MKIINERSKIYGDFRDIAGASQKIKDLYYLNNAEEFDPAINEAFDMIAHKLGRIINGGSRYIDNWRDIAGYAQLVVDYLEKEAKDAVDAKVEYIKKENGKWKKDQN